VKLLLRGREATPVRDIDKKKCRLTPTRWGANDPVLENPSRP